MEGFLSRGREGTLVLETGRRGQIFRGSRVVERREAAAGRLS
jgi:hypothetical protein